MGFLANVTLVFVAGLITALATGLGALPFFAVEEVSDRWNVGLWGLASGIMLSASVFGLINEGLAHGTPLELGGGLLLGVILVVVSGELLERVDPDVGDDVTGATDDDHDEDEMAAQAFVRGDMRQLILILGVLTVHSFPEGVAIGVSFAELGLSGVSGVSFLGFAVPLLAVFMTLAISIQNVPEGLAIAIPLQSFDVDNWRTVGWAVFSSLPQPIGAVIAFGFVRWAQAFMPYGFGFAAGAMIYLVATELVPEGLETGEHLSRHGYPEMVGGLAAGFLVMVPLVFL